MRGFARALLMRSFAGIAVRARGCTVHGVARALRGMHANVCLAQLRARHQPVRDTCPAEAPRLLVDARVTTCRTTLARREAIMTVSGVA